MTIVQIADTFKPEQKRRFVAISAPVAGSEIRSKNGLLQLDGQPLSAGLAGVRRIPSSCSGQARAPCWTGPAFGRTTSTWMCPGGGRLCKPDEKLSDDRLGEPSALFLANRNRQHPGTGGPIPGIGCAGAPAPTTNSWSSLHPQAGEDHRRSGGE